MPSSTDSICAVATAPGRAALAVIRLSGPDAHAIAEQVTHRKLAVREAVLTGFYDAGGERIDQGIALYFQAPASFSGEDLVEFHSHGSPVVCDLLLDTLCAHGARLAEPGEFSLRAFLNHKIDLAQAEAIADLIASSTEQCARLANRSLQGLFSARVQETLERLVAVRAGIEAYLDFPDEDLDVQHAEHFCEQLDALGTEITELLEQAQAGERMNTGATLAIAGAPNVGKSSLINALAQSDLAIVTDTPGTTRDPVAADIEIAGMPVHVVDTAGVRNTEDVIEREGIARTRRTLAQADLVVWMDDVTQPPGAQAPPEEVDVARRIRAHNKIDLTGRAPEVLEDEVYLSVKTASGMQALIDLIRSRLQGDEQASTPFLARRRHRLALQRTREHIRAAAQGLREGRGLELAGEDLRLAQQALGEITGEFSSDDLLGRIFSEFCIGK